MKWMMEYILLIPLVVLIIAGIIGIRSSKSVAQNKIDPDPELAKTYKVLGWLGFLFGTVLLLAFILKRVL